MLMGCRIFGNKLERCGTLRLGEGGRGGEGKVG